MARKSKARFNPSQWTTHLKASRVGNKLIWDKYGVRITPRDENGTIQANEWEELVGLIFEDAVNAGALKLPKGYSIDDFEFRVRTERQGKSIGYFTTLTNRKTMKLLTENDCEGEKWWGREAWGLYTNTKMKSAETRKCLEETTRLINSSL